MSVISPLDSWTWLGFALSILFGSIFLSIYALVENNTNPGDLIFFLFGTFMDESQPETTKFR